MYKYLYFITNDIKFISNNSIFLFLFIFTNIFIINSQSDSLEKLKFNWIKITDGLEYTEITAPKQSIIGDSKLTFVKINPKYIDFDLYTAGNLTKKSLNVEQWADSFSLNVVFNAAMYELSKQTQSRGYLKNKKYINNNKINPNFNALFCFKPLKTNLPQVDIIDLTKTNINLVKSNYDCIIQSIRMIDNDGNPIFWKKKAQSCSMLVSAIDNEKNVYLIFCRSPFYHNDMIKFLLKFPTKLYSAIYLEGGPQTSLYIEVPTENDNPFCLEKVGSYVSETYPNDNNYQYWKLPNVVGLTIKKINK